MAYRIKQDMILLDIQLPVMDGHFVARKLRQDQYFAGVSIVAFTSYAMISDHEMAIEAGCTDYIKKPIDLEPLIAQIEQHFPDKINVREQIIK